MVDMTGSYEPITSYIQLLIKTVILGRFNYKRQLRIFYIRYVILSFVNFYFMHTTPNKLVALLIKLMLYLTISTHQARTRAE